MACCFPHATSWFRNLTVFRGRLWTAVHWRDSSLHRTNCNIVKEVPKASKTQCVLHCSTKQGFNYLLSQPGVHPCSPAPDHCQTLPIILFVFRACLNIVWPPLTLGIYTLILHFTPWKSLEARLEPPHPPNPCLMLLHGHETFSTWVIPPRCQRDQLDLVGGGGWVAAG